MDKVVLTQGGYDKLIEELNFLKTTKRKQVAEQLATARAHGDLRENAEYDAAKETKAHLETRIQKLELKLSEAKVVDINDMPRDNSHMRILGTFLVWSDACLGQLGDLFRLQKLVIHKDI